MKALTIPIFTFAAAGPLAVLAAGCLWGGGWIWLGFLLMGGAVAAVDMLVPLVAGDAEGEFPGSDALLVGLGLGALGLLPLAVHAVAAGDFGWAERVALFLAAGLWFGQVAHPAAHELIHRSRRPLVWLGIAVYAALLFGHHASSHKLVHHRFVGTPQDPNTARAGEGFYRFMLRAWVESFRAGHAAEVALRRGRGATPYLAYGIGAALALGTGYLVAGGPGVLVWLALGLHFGGQVLVSDYVQHYGLTRAVKNGRQAPVSDGESWNAPHLFTSALMLNAPRHSDHHAHPSRPYPALRLAGDLPMLPWPLPLACLIALWPAWWKRRMAPLLASLAKP